MGGQRWGQESFVHDESYNARSPHWGNDEEDYLLRMCDGWIAEGGLTPAALANARCCYYPKEGDRRVTGRPTEGVVKSIYQIENMRERRSRDDLEMEFARHSMAEYPKAGLCRGFGKGHCYHGEGCKYVHVG